MDKIPKPDEHLNTFLMVLPTKGVNGLLKVLKSWENIAIGSSTNMSFFVRNFLNMEVSRNFAEIVIFCLVPICQIQNSVFVV